MILGVSSVLRSRRPAMHGPHSRMRSTFVGVGTALVVPTWAPSKGSRCPPSAAAATRSRVPKPPARDKHEEGADREDCEGNATTSLMLKELRDKFKMRSSKEADEEVDDGDDAIDVRFLERSGEICILGSFNAGKSTLVNALVGEKVSIVTKKPQTTRQTVLGLALVSPRPGAPPTTQACFVDTPGIFRNENMQENHRNFGSSAKLAKVKFKTTMLHKAMLKTAWKAMRQVDIVWWVLDAQKCYFYGDYTPVSPMLDGVIIGDENPDGWWLHPEMIESYEVLQRIRKRHRKVQVVLTKVDYIKDKCGVDVDEFALNIRTVLERDLGVDENGSPLMTHFWPISALKSRESLVPLRRWLCENLPKQAPLYPVDAVSDVPARVVASEITREKLMLACEKDVAFCFAVVTAAWREGPDGVLSIGQKIVVKRKYEENQVRRALKEVVPKAERDISDRVNFGKQVHIHYRIVVDKDWDAKEEYYDDLKGALGDRESLRFQFK